MDELKTVNCEQLMTTLIKPIEFCFDGMLSTGLFILAGAPKVGKSWLALDMALSIAKGKKCSDEKPNAARLSTSAWRTATPESRIVCLNSQASRLKICI